MAYHTRNSGAGDRVRAREAERQELGRARRARRAERENQLYQTRTQQFINRAQERGSAAALKRGHEYAAKANMYGDSIAGYRDRMEGYSDNQAKRNLMADQGYAARRTADGAYRTGEASYLSAQNELPKARLVSQTQLALGQMESGDKRYISDREISAAQAKYIADREQARRDAARATMEKKLDRESEEKIAKFKSQGDIYSNAGAFKGRDIFDNKGNKIGDRLYNFNTGEWEEHYDPEKRPEPEDE